MLKGLGGQSSKEKLLAGCAVLIGVWNTALASFSMVISDKLDQKF